MADDDKTTPSMEERLAALEADLKAERDGRAQDRQRNEMLESTLRAIGQQNQQPARQAPASPQSFNVPPPSAEQMAILRSVYAGSSDEEISQWYRNAGVLFALHAQPLVGQVFGALGQTADLLDTHHALLEVDDYKPNRKEIETLRREYLDTGRPVPSRAELTQIVKARKLPELVQAETERRMKAEEDRRASAASATTESGSVTAARPSPASGGTKPLGQMAPEERETALAAMSREDRTKALEAEIGDTPIP